MDLLLESVEFHSHLLLQTRRLSLLGDKQMRLLIVLLGRPRFFMLVSKLLLLMKWN